MELYFIRLRGIRLCLKSFVSHSVGGSLSILEKNTDYALDGASSLNPRVGSCSQDLIVDCVWETYG